MPTCTPVYGLPYIQGSDRPCDQSDTWCEFATAIDDALTRLDAIVDRTVDTIPQAQVRMTLPRTQPANAGGGTPQFIPFDTVDADTADMVDLTASPFTITLPRHGVYFVYYTVEGTTAGAGVQWRTSARTPANGFAPSQANQFYLDDGSTPVLMASSGLYRYQSPVPAGTTGYTTSDARVVFNVDAATTLPLTAATFGIYWMRDLP